MVIYIFQRFGLFHRSFQIYCHKVVEFPLSICMVCSNASCFITDIDNLYLLFFFLSPARRCIELHKHFFCCFIDFNYSDLSFKNSTLIYYFLFFDLFLAFSEFYGFLRWKLKWSIWDHYFLIQVFITMNGYIYVNISILELTSGLE